MLVITLCINNFNVHRILVDLGSAADLLHFSAFKQMKVPFDKLRLPGRVFSEFSGATTLTVADIALPSRQGRSRNT